MSGFESAPMQFECSTLKFVKAALVFGVFVLGPAFAQPNRPDSMVLLQGSQAVQQSLGVDYARVWEAARLAQRLEADKTYSPAEVAKVEQGVEPALRQLNKYPNLSRVHSHEEPTWLSDRGEVTAQAILALSALERMSPKPERRESLKKLAQGLVALQRKDRVEYPFGAHISWQDSEPMAQLADGTSVPTAFYRTDRAYAVQALAEAGRLLDRSELLESAKREALAMSTHLVIHGDLIRSFSPQPELSQNANDCLPLVAGFLALHKVTDQRLYSDLAALATLWDSPKTDPSGPQWSELKKQILAGPSAHLLKARPSGKPITFHYVEAEDGKVVNEAIDSFEYRTAANGIGRLAVMGRENTFWMRFDVPTEDDYLFDLAYLQSDVGAGLVSVMMRIDGDKIFQVPLGDVDGRPILRRRNVDGPRPLRSGPHSFGIRFSGLLMTKPALLDAIVVQPALERREFILPDGKKLYLLRNVSDETARTDEHHFDTWPPLDQIVVDGNGMPSTLGTAEDRRRRKKYVTLAPFGVALVTVNAAPEKEH